MFLFLLGIVLVSLVPSIEIKENNHIPNRFPIVSYRSPRLNVSSCPYSSQHISCRWQYKSIPAATHPAVPPHIPLPQQQIPSSSGIGTGMAGEANLAKHKVNTCSANLLHFISSAESSIHLPSFIHSPYWMALSHLLTNHLRIRQIQVLHDVDKRINVLTQARIELLLLGNCCFQLAPVIERGKLLSGVETHKWI